MCLQKDEEVVGLLLKSSAEIPSKKCRIFWKINTKNDWICLLDLKLKKLKMKRRFGDKYFTKKSLTFTNDYDQLHRLFYIIIMKQHNTLYTFRRS